MTEVKSYTCQSCSKCTLDKTEMKMIVMMGIGFVICRECLKKWAEE